MSRVSVSLRAAAVAVPVLFIVIACSPLKQVTERAVGGWYMQLQVNPNAARSITVSQYTVTGLTIEVRDPGGGLLQTITWAASDGPKTYQVPVGEAGEHQINVTHTGVLNGQTVQATESAAFDIEAMRITVIGIVPGEIGTIGVQGGQPDLVVSSLSVTSWTSTSISYSYTIKNIGTAPANLDGPTSADSDNVSVQAFLSADTVFDNAGDIAAGGTILGSSPLGNLNPGQTFSGSFSSSASVDPSVTPYLVLKVDWGNVVAESDETNNTLAAPIIAGQPDLIVSALSVTSWTPNSISFSYTISNVGTAPANLDGPTADNSDNVSVQAFLSADTIFDNAGDIAAGGSILGSSPLGTLAPGQTFSGSFSSTVAVNPAVTPYIVLKVDWGNVVAESDETNNTRAAPIITGQPDLVVSTLAVENATLTSISYIYTITNIGTGPANLDGPTSADADNVSVQAVVSSDTVFQNDGDQPAGGTILGPSPLGYLNPGESFTGSFSSSTIVNPFIPQYLVLMVDYGHVVAESNEGNNTLAVPIF